jgi:hypothetical protein
VPDDRKSELLDECSRWTLEQLTAAPRGIGDLYLIRAARQHGFRRERLNEAVQLLLKLDYVRRHDYAYFLKFPRTDEPNTDVRHDAGNHLNGATHQ